MIPSQHPPIALRAVFPVKVIALVCLALATLLPSHGADLPQGTVKGWEATVTENNRVTTVFSGDEAVGNRIKNLKIQINEDSPEAKPEFFIESPDCIWDKASNNASSKASIQLSTVDRSLIIQGEGWMWSQRQSLLVISNKVSTTIRRQLKDLITPNAPATAGKDDEVSVIHVQSERFSFKRATSKATFLDQVNVTDPGRLELECGRLKVDLGQGSRGLQEVLAEDQVQLKLLDPELRVTAKSGRALYIIENDVDGNLELLDTPTWSAPGYEGGGDRIQVFDREGQRSFKVSGRAWAHLDPTSVRPSANEKEDGRPVVPIEINSEEYDFDGEKVRFTGRVKAVQESAWNLTCDHLEAGVDTKTRQFGGIDAKGNVHLTQQRDGKTLVSTADHVRYLPAITGEETGVETLVLTGAAKVDAGEFVAKGKTIEVSLAQDAQTLHVKEDAILELPATTISSIGILNLPGKTTDASSTGKSMSDESLQITSNTYRFEGDRAVFQDGVLIQFLDSDLTCDTLDVVFSEDRKSIRSLVAMGNVVLSSDEARMNCGRMEGFFSETTQEMERMEAEGPIRITHPMGKARSDRAIFYPQAFRTELIGNPQALVTLPGKNGAPPRHIMVEGDLLDWDQVQNRFSGRGNYRFKTVDNPDLW